MSQTKGIILFLGMLAFFYAVPAPVTTYFFEDRFDVDDAAPLSDPHTSTGGQSVDITEIDGSLAISGGKVSVVKQTTPVSGENGYEYETSKTSYIGAAALFKIVPKEFGSTGSAAFGFSDAINDVDNTNMAFQSILMGATKFEAINHNQTPAVNAFTLPTTPSLNDTFYLAYINGGYDDDSGHSGAVPWYPGAGLSLSDYSEGSFMFIKKNDGPWLLQNVNPVCSRAAMYPAFNTYNASYEIYDMVVLADGDSAYRPYLEPKHYQSASPSSGSFFLDSPEVGANYDSTKGSFVLTSGAVFGSGSPPATYGFITVASVGDSNVFGYALNNLSTTSGQSLALVLRWVASSTKHLIVFASGTSDLFQIYSFDGSSYTLRASTAVSLQATNNYIYTIGAAVIDSTIHAYWIPSTGTSLYLTYTSQLHTNYGLGGTKHGIRIQETTRGFKFIRFYEMGKDGEYSDLSNFFNPEVPASRRKIYFR